MAELNTSATSTSGRRGRAKQLPKVDLTAMVDLAFLLITFFMLTTTLVRNNAMDLAMPLPEAAPTGIADDRTITICMGKDNSVLWYMGALEKPITKPTLEKSFDRMHRLMVDLNERIVEKTGRPDKGLITLIKPSDKSNYKNLVDILDETVLANVASYAIVDITKEELQLMNKSGIY